jgi:hypothetical protein
MKRYNEVISVEQREKISKRYHKITSAINEEFWKINSSIDHSLYVGSYGRNTAICTSDIDILLCLPSAIFDRFNALTGNSQSRLLQAVKTAIKEAYPNSDIRADGQIIKIAFSDGIIFECLPAFKNTSGSFVYPDSNMGGKWLSTNPKAEQEAIRDKNKTSNGLLVSTCKHMRYIRDNFFKSYKLSGIVIDSFAYQAIGSWRFTESGGSEPFSYEKHLLAFYNEHCFSWLLSGMSAPGSNDKIDISGSSECLEKVLKYMVEE